MRKNLCLKATLRKKNILISFEGDGGGVGGEGEIIHRAHTVYSCAAVYAITISLISIVDYRISPTMDEN